MDKADRAGLGVAVVGHVALFGALSLGLLASNPPKPVPPPPMEVAFVDEVAPAPAAPSSQAPAAEAPEIGPVEEAMPQVEPTPAPVVEPSRAPAPEPAPAPPVPKAKPMPPVARPKAQPSPQPSPQSKKPAPAKLAKAASPKPASVKVATAKPAKDAKPKDAKPGGAEEKTASRATRLGRDFLAGLSDPSPGKASAAAAPVMSADAMATIVAAIRRQVQPCANRQVNPGPGASRIKVRLQLRLNRDGSLATAPRVVSASGVDDENSRYEKRVADLAIAAYTGCAPMRGLPDELYRTAKGGWSNIAIIYKLPG